MVVYIFKPLAVVRNNFEMLLTVGLLRKNFVKFSFIKTNKNNIFFN